MKWMMVLAAAATLSASGASKWTLAHLPDGQPDFQGYWTNATYTPLERDRDLGTKEFFTPDEAAAYAKKREQIENSQSKDDIHYDNVLWQTENYAKVVVRNRTSIVFDPPDGRIPELTPAARAIVAARAEYAKSHGPSDQASSRSLGERCISWGNEGPPMLGSTYQANLQIMQTPGRFVIRQEIMNGKGLCFTCHTLGKTEGPFRFPDLSGVDARAKMRKPGYSDVDYFAETIYEPNAFIVPGFNPGMPVINKPPIGLNDQEILVRHFHKTVGDWVASR